MPHTQLNLNEAADYLHLSPDKVEALIRSENFSIRYVRKKPMFSKRELHDWMSKKLLGIVDDSVDKFHENVSTTGDESSEPENLFLSQFLEPSVICPELSAKTKNSALRGLVDIAIQSNLVTDETELLELIMEREALCSTGLANGVAMPHSRIHANYLILDSFLAIAHVPGGIPFGSLDGKLTDLFFMPCASNDRIHLHMIARIALLLNKTDLADKLRQCVSAEEMIDTIRAIESEFVSSGNKNERQ